MSTTRPDDLPVAPPAPFPAPAEGEDAGETVVGGTSPAAREGREEAAERVEDVDDNMATIDA